RTRAGMAGIVLEDTGMREIYVARMASRCPPERDGHTVGPRQPDACPGRTVEPPTAARSAAPENAGGASSPGGRGDSMFSFTRRTGRSPSPPPRFLNMSDYETQFAASGRDRTSLRNPGNREKGPAFPEGGR